MIHHLSFSVADLKKSAAFYDAVLGALIYRRVWTGKDGVGYGLEENKDLFALKQRVAKVTAPSAGFHLAFAAKSREQVDAFYRLAMEMGAKDNGAPGLRPHYGKHYYAAFVIDPDGYEIEVVFNTNVDSQSIEAPRLWIKQVPPEDAAKVATFQRTNREFMAEHEPPRPADYYTEEHWREKLADLQTAAQEDKHYSYFVFAKATPDEIIGWINFSNVVRGAFHACHLGYNLSKAYEGHGYMTEALTAAIDLMFREKNLHRIMANYVPSNKRSERVLERLGFQREGMARDYLLLGGSWKDHVLTSLTNQAWKK